MSHVVETWTLVDVTTGKEIPGETFLIGYDEEVEDRDAVVQAIREDLRLVENQDLGELLGEEIVED